ncbi:MAG: hypothetical protein HYV07_08965 [Deltaproteobacteria bacterium]|nr:hypothetical protein [Deltaproteobacteria bacterium]
MSTLISILVVTSCGGPEQDTEDTSAEARHVRACTVSPNPVTRGASYVVSATGLRASQAAAVSIVDALGSQSLSAVADSAGNLSVSVEARVAGAGSIQITQDQHGSPRRAACSFTAVEPGSCVPRSCADAGAECGAVSDGCGGTLTCGSCAAGQDCANNQCVTSCVPRSCVDAGAECGAVSDGCGGTLSCGSCAAGQSCGSANQCVDVSPRVITRVVPVSPVTALVYLEGQAPTESHCLGLVQGLGSTGWCYASYWDTESPIAFSGLTPGAAYTAFYGTSWGAGAVSFTMPTLGAPESTPPTAVGLRVYRSCSGAPMLTLDANDDTGIQGAELFADGVSVGSAGVSVAPRQAPGGVASTAQSLWLRLPSTLSGTTATFYAVVTDLFGNQTRTADLTQVVP